MAGPSALSFTDEIFPRLCPPRLSPCLVTRTALPLTAHDFSYSVWSCTPAPALPPICACNPRKQSRPTLAPLSRAPAARRAIRPGALRPGHALFLPLLPPHRPVRRFARVRPRAPRVQRKAALALFGARSRPRKSAPRPLPPRPLPPRPLKHAASALECRAAFRHAHKTGPARPAPQPVTSQKSWLAQLQLPCRTASCRQITAGTKRAGSSGAYAWVRPPRCASAAA
jgi:hypothetical protein